MVEVTIVYRNCGMVICQNRCQAFAPSSSAASYMVTGICRAPAW